MIKHITHVHLLGALHNLKYSFNAGISDVLSSLMQLFVSTKYIKTTIQHPNHA